MQYLAEEVDRKSTLNILSEVQPLQRLAHREEWPTIKDIRANTSARWLLSIKYVAQEMSHHCCVRVSVVLCSHCCCLLVHSLMRHNAILKIFSQIKSNTNTLIMYGRENGRRRAGGLMREKIHPCNSWEGMKSSECSMTNGHIKGKTKLTPP